MTRLWHYADPSKRPVTEPFSNTARMVLASSGAMDKHGQLWELLVLADRQRVGDDHLAGAALGQPLRRGIGQHTVRRGDDDVASRRPRAAA